MPVILYAMWVLFIGIPVGGILMSNYRIAKLAKVEK